MKDFYQELITQKFVALLKKYSLNVTDLSIQTNIDKSKFSRVIHKKGLFTIPELHAIANFFKVDLNYFVSVEDEPSVNLMPILDITKESSELQVCQLPYESSNKKALIGVYIDKSLATNLIPKSIILIVDMGIKKYKMPSKPVAFLYRKRLYLGLVQGDDVFNVATQNILPLSQVDILGLIEQQVVEMPKQLYADKTVFEQFLAKVSYLDLRYDYLYKLLLTS